MAGKTLLVVEDNAIQREGLAAVLREHGYTVLTAADGDEAMSWLRSEPPPDLVLLDMIIPRTGHDGWYFLEQRRRHPALASIPVIITTALGNASQEWAAALGARGLLRKPVEVEPLLTHLNRCLDP
jgi:CheY-like chemotaxis protein